MALVCDCAPDGSIIQVSPGQELGGQVPEVIHKVLMQHLGGEPGTADAHLPNQASRISLQGNARNGGFVREDDSFFEENHSSQCRTSSLRQASIGVDLGRVKTRLAAIEAKHGQ